MGQYEVGNILWIVHKDKPGLMAYQVVEEVTKKKLHKEETYYIVKSASSNHKELNLKDIDGVVFSDKEKARNVMIENATKAIDNMLNSVEDNINRYFISTSENNVYHQHNKNLENQMENNTNENLPEGYQWIDMDGKKIKVKLPSTLI